MHHYLQATLNFLNDIIPNKDWFIAGGSAASESYNDVDVYFTSQQAYDIAATLPLNFFAVTKNAKTFEFGASSQTRNIQFISRQIGDYISVIESFDLNKARCVIFPDGTRYNHKSSQLPLHFTIDTFNKDTISRFAKYIHVKGFEPDPSMIPVFTTLLQSDFVAVEDYYDNQITKVSISPIRQLYSYYACEQTLQFAYAALEGLPPELRLRRYLYLFNCWKHLQLPIQDTLSTECLYAYSKIYNVPHHQRVFDENPEYLL